MSATFSPTAAPANALLIWTDGRSIYVELPSKPNVPPCIITYRLSEGGLSKALALLGKHADIAGSPQVSVPVRRAKDYVGAVGQHALAESILRKRGIIK